MLGVPPTGDQQNQPAQQPLGATSPQGPQQQNQEQNQQVMVIPLPAVPQSQQQKDSNSDTMRKVNQFNKAGTALRGDEVDFEKTRIPGGGDKTKISGKNVEWIDTTDAHAGYGLIHLVVALFTGAMFATTLIMSNLPRNCR